MASRIAARSTTAGTPVKSCSSTRAGMKAISFSGAPGRQFRQRANILCVDEAAVFAAQQIFEKNAQGKREAWRGRRRPAAQETPAGECRNVCAPTFNLSRVRKELPALMAILTVLSLWYVAHYDNRNRIRAPRSYTGMAVNIVLISTYELGRQPFGLASPAAWLRKRGHSVVALDLARQSLDESAIACCRADRHLSSDAHGHAAGGAAHSSVAETESHRASLLLWPVCADEC